MAVPKKKMSRSRTRSRKAQTMRAPQTSTVDCPRCGSPKLPHRACSGADGCGTYRNRTVAPGAG